MIRKRVSLLTTFLVVCLILPVLSPSNEVEFVAGQAVGWSDNFDDGNIDGWTVQGFNWPSFTPLPGNFTADDHTLRAGVIHGLAGQSWWSQAYRPSTTAYGSWSFDYHCVSTPSNHSYIAFISGPAMVAGNTSSTAYEYGIIPFTGVYGSWDHSFVFYRRRQGDMNIIQLGTYDVEEVSGWYHIDITRNLEGNFVVSFNGTARITVTQATYNTSSIFSFYTEAGNALDNIVVIPHPVDGEPIDMTLLLIVGGGIAVVVVIAIIIKSRS